MEPGHEYINGVIADLPQRPLLEHPHHIIPVNDEEDEALMTLNDRLMNHLPDLQIEDVDVFTHAHGSLRLPEYGPSNIVQFDLTSTRLPDRWQVYSGMNYYGLEGENQDEDQNTEEDDVQNTEEDDEEDLEEKTRQDPINLSTKRPISTTKQSLEDMIRSSGDEPYIATIGLEDELFVPTLELRFSSQ